MKIQKEIENQNLPSIIMSDLNGKILHLNQQASVKLNTVKAGDSVSKVIDFDYVKRLSMLDNVIVVEKPKALNFTRAVVKVLGVGANKILEIYLFDNAYFNDENLIDDVKLFSTYSDIANCQVSKSVQMEDFLTTLVSTLKDDIRFSYRKFENRIFIENPQLYVNFSHISTIITGTVVALNEMEYRNPINIKLDNVLGEWVLKISVDVDNCESAFGIFEISKIFPHATMRMMYITSLCQQDEIECDFTMHANKIIGSFNISNAMRGNKALQYSPFSTEDIFFIKQALDIFSPEISDTEEEEQEE